MPVTAHRARSLAEATPLPPGVSCVLLDLGLPDSRELQGVRWLHEQLPQVAVVVLTGLSDEHLGAAAVRAGAQDYLVKGQVDGQLLHRVIRYAVERRRLEETQRQLREAQIIARENARLERGLLPSPMLADPRVTVAARYRPGGGQSLLGGDFYDVVETADGWVHALVGDVCGRGPDEAALGVCLRVAWRTMVLAGRPMDEILSAVERVLEDERQHDRMFTTALRAVRSPPTALSGRLLPGRAPAAAAADPGRGARADRAGLPAAGHRGRPGDWPASEVELGPDWSVLMYTDGLIEGRIGDGRRAAGHRRPDRDDRGHAARRRRRAPPDRRRRDDQLLDQLVEPGPRAQRRRAGRRPGRAGGRLPGRRASDDRPDDGHRQHQRRRRDRPAPGPRPPAPPARTSDERVARVTGGWPVGRMIAVGIAFMAVFSLLAIVIGALALTDLSSARNQVVQNAGPGRLPGLAAVRGPAQPGDRGPRLRAQRAAVVPGALHRRAWPRQQHALRRLRPVLAGLPVAQGALAQVIRKAGDWRASYAARAIAQVASHRQAPGQPADVQRGKADFDSIRAAMTALQDDISGAAAALRGRAERTPPAPWTARSSASRRACC